MKQLEEWLCQFEHDGGRLVREIQQKKELIALINGWNAAFAGQRDRGSRQFDGSSLFYLLSAHRGLHIPAHHAQGLTFALELQPPRSWKPDCAGIPGEFIMFDATYRWSISVTHEATEIICSPAV